jgi:hypothetical protein
LQVRYYQPVAIQVEYYNEEKKYGSQPFQAINL